MLKIENFEVVGWEHAIRGMRNPMNSWEKSDSRKFVDNDPEHPFRCCPYDDCYGCHNMSEEDGVGCERPDWDNFGIGPNDRDLMMRLANGGPVHAKYRRMITVYLDITAPLYWWKEFDTYHVGTVANSCSTMHKIHAKEFTLEDFSHEHLIVGGDLMKEHGDLTYASYIPIPEHDGVHCLWSPSHVMKVVIMALNANREAYLKTKDKIYWWQMIQLLPTSYNQRRTVMLNYEVLTNIYHSRKNHKLDEWHTFCEWIESLPYSELITGKEKE